MVEMYTVEYVSKLKFHVNKLLRGFRKLLDISLLRQGQWSLD